MLVTESEPVHADLSSSHVIPPGLALFSGTSHIHASQPFTRFLHAKSAPGFYDYDLTSLSESTPLRSIFLTAGVKAVLYEGFFAGKSVVIDSSIDDIRDLSMASVSSLSLTLLPLHMHKGEWARSPCRHYIMS
jgi:hypothetical protein